MKMRALFWTGVVLAWLGCGGMALGEGWSWNPFAKDKKERSVSSRPVTIVDHGPGMTRRKEPSPMKKFSDGTKKVFTDANNGTKKFFGNAKDMMTGKKSAKKPKRNSRKKKPAWWNSWFVKSEPKPPRTPSDFIALPRLDP